MAGGGGGSSSTSRLLFFDASEGQFTSTARSSSTAKCSAVLFGQYQTLLVLDVRDYFFSKYYVSLFCVVCDIGSIQSWKEEGGLSHDWTRVIRGAPPSAHAVTNCPRGTLGEPLGGFKFALPWSTGSVEPALHRHFHPQRNGPATGGGGRQRRSKPSHQHPGTYIY